MKYCPQTTLLIAICFSVNYCDASDQKQFQGNWTGTEGDAKLEVNIHGQRIHFNSSTGEWYKGTFSIDATTKPKQITVTVEDCPFVEFNGQVSLGVYRLNGDSLSISACRPGDPTGPSGFDDPRVRLVELTRKK